MWAVEKQETPCYFLIEEALPDVASTSHLRLASRCLRSLLMADFQRILLIFGHNLEAAEGKIPKLSD